MQRLKDLTAKSKTMSEEVEEIFNKYLDGINSQLEKSGQKMIKITTPEEFAAEAEN